MPKVGEYSLNRVNRLFDGQNVAETGHFEHFLDFGACVLYYLGALLVHILLCPGENAPACRRNVSEFLEVEHQRL